MSEEIRVSRFFRGHPPDSFELAADALALAAGCVPVPADYWAEFLQAYGIANDGCLDVRDFERVWIPATWAERWAQEKAPAKP